MKTRFFLLSMLLIATSSLTVAEEAAASSDGHNTQTGIVVNAEADENTAIKDYSYGMKLDIVRVISTAGPSHNCYSEPQLMTYEDSKGQLQTIRYLALGNCPSNQG